MPHSAIAAGAEERAVELRRSRWYPVGAALGSKRRTFLMTTFRFGDFEWDDAKARANVRKHGVSFSEAVTCFLDPEAFTAPDKDYPNRFILIGLSRQLRVLFVVSAEAGERIRIISARKASPAQRKVYEHGP